MKKKKISRAELEKLAGAQHQAVCDFLARNEVFSTIEKRLASYSNEFYLLQELLKSEGPLKADSLRISVGVKSTVSTAAKRLAAFLEKISKEYGVLSSQGIVITIPRRIGGAQVGYYFCCAKDRTYRTLSSEETKKTLEDTWKSCSQHAPHAQTLNELRNELPHSRVGCHITLCDIIGEADVYKQINDLFIAPEGYNEIAQAVESLRPVLIIGHSGQGKSYLAYHFIKKALEEGKKANYIRDAITLERRYEAHNTDLLFSQSEMPCMGITVLDDPWGKEGYPEVGNRVYSSVLKLCNATSGCKCQLIITSQKKFLNNRKYIRDLKAHNVYIFDLSVKDAQFSQGDKAEVFKRIIKLRDPSMQMPLTKNKLVDCASNLVVDYDFSMFDVQYWANIALLMSTRKKLQGSIRRTKKNRISESFKEIEIAPEQKIILFKIFLMRGALYDDVYKLITDGSNKVLGKYFGLPSHIFNCFLCVANHNGEKRVFPRHDIVMQELEERLFITIDRAKIMQWIYDLLNCKYRSIQVAVVHLVFSIKQRIGERFDDIFKYIFRNYSSEESICHGAKYEAIRLFALSVNRNDQELSMKIIHYFKYEARIRHYRLRVKGMYTQFIRLIIRDYENMPKELCGIVDDVVNKLFSSDVSRLVSTELVREVMYEMFKRPLFFYDKLIKLIVNWKYVLRDSAVERLSYLYRNKELEFEQICLLTDVVATYCDPIGIESLRKSLRNKPNAYSTSECVILLRAIRRLSW